MAGPYRRRDDRTGGQSGRMAARVTRRMVQMGRVMAGPLATLVLLVSAKAQIGGFPNEPAVSHQDGSGIVLFSPAHGHWLMPAAIVLNASVTPADQPFVWDDITS